MDETNHTSVNSGRQTHLFHGRQTRYDAPLIRTLCGIRIPAHNAQIPGDESLMCQNCARIEYTCTEHDA